MVAEFKTDTHTHTLIEKHTLESQTDNDLHTANVLKLFDFLTDRN